MLALALLAAAAPRALRADGPRAYFELQAYDAPRSCPARQLFERRVAERLASSATRPVRTAGLRVHVTTEPGRVHGTLTLDEGASRSLSGASCREVVEGLALVAALALMGEGEAAAPEAARRAPAAESGARSAQESSSASTVERDTQPAQPPPPSAEGRALQGRPSGAGAAGASPPPSRERPRPLRAGIGARSSPEPGLQLGAGLLVFHGIAPALQPGLQLTAAGALPLPDLTLSAQLAGRLAPSQTLARADGDAHFGFAGGALGLCATAALGGQVLSVRGCGVAEAGVLRWSATDTDQARAYARGWLALGPGLSLVVRGSWLGAVAGAELLWPTRRDRALLAGDVLQRVPEVCLRLLVGLEVRLDVGP